MMRLHPTHWFPAEGDGTCAGCGRHWVSAPAATARPCPTPHPRVAEWISSGFTVITLRRAVNIGGPHRPQGWTYSWQPATPLPFPGQQPDGIARPGSWVGYGRDLAGLRAMLRRRYGRDVVLVEEWRWEPVATKAESK